VIKKTGLFRSALWPLSLAVGWVLILIALVIRFNNWRFLGLIGFACILMLPWTASLLANTEVRAPRVLWVTLALISIGLVLSVLIWLLTTALGVA